MLNRKYLFIGFILFGSFFQLLNAQTYQVGSLITNSDGSQGVVFFVHPDGTGGWMVALNDFPTVSFWSTDPTDIPTLTNINFTIYPGSSARYYAALYDTAGYSNTQKIRNFQNNSNNTAAGRVDFVNGWYLPAMGQLSELYGAQPIINSTIIASGGTILSSSSHQYWSSTEYDATSSWSLITDNGSSTYSGKSINRRVRAVRSFSNQTILYDTTLTYLWSTGSTQPYITPSPTSTTTYTVTATSGIGCSNSVTQTIFVNSATPQTLYDTVCVGYSYQGNGFNILASDNQATGTTLHTRTVTQNDCQATIQLYLYKKPNEMATLNVAICQGEEYYLNGVEYYNAGTYIQNFNSVNGCDSTLTLHITFYPAPTTVIYKTACNSFTWNNNTYTQSGNYTQSFIGQNGCDSTVTLHLTLHQTIYSTLKDTTCSSYPYNGFGFNLPATALTTPGISYFKDTLTTQFGCDSIVTLMLIVLPNTASTITQTVNENQLPITFNGQTFNSNVLNQLITITNTNGCDSVINYTLHVNWNTSSHIFDTICQNSLPFLWNGITFNTAGIQSATLTSYSGADSVVTMTLVVHPNTTSTITQTVNENQLPITFNGLTFTGEVVNYVITLNNANGCDSVITYTIHVNWNTNNHIFDTICQNSLPYVWNGVTFNNPGTQFATLTSYTGADSVVTMTLVVNTNTTSPITQTVNENQLPITFNGQTFNGEVVNHVLTINNTNGCDSVISFTLHVNWNTYSTIDTTVCSYNLPINWRGFTFTQESVVYDTTLNANNTQHFITYFVDVDTLTNIQFSGFTNPVCPSISSQQITANITTGISPYLYSWSGDSIISSSQNQTLVKIAPSSCGAVRKIYLEVQDQIGCTIMDSVNIQINTTQPPSLSSTIPALNSPVTNCQFSVPNLDSLVRSHSVDNCYPSDSLTIIQNPLAGTAILSTTNINITISNPCGNSIQTTVSVIVPTALSTSINNITHVSCFGQTTGGATAVPSGGTPNYSYSWSTQSTPSTIIATTNAISNVAAGTYRVTVSDHSGCTATSNVTILNQSTAMSPGDITANQSVCLGTSPAPLTGTSATGGINSSYQWQKSFDNSIFSAAGGTINTQNYTPSTLTQNTYFRRAWISVACGTVYSDTLLITILPVYRDTIQGEVCRGTQYQSQGFNLPSDSTQIIGDHYFTNHLTSFQNCDSIVVLQLNVLPDFENEYNANSCNSYNWNDITYTETGDYTQSFQALNGCDSTVTLHLIVSSSETTNISDTICQGNSYDENGFYLTPPVTDIVQIIEQEITLHNESGCDSVIALSLFVIDTSTII